MTANTFKQKAPTVQAIEVTDVLVQSADVANLIRSQAYQVDVAAKESTFVLNGAPALAVKEGQVVSWLDGAAIAWDAEDFYAQYETV